MVSVTPDQIDALALRSADALAEGLADKTFGVQGAYAPMPREVRILLARAALAEARSHGIDSLDDLATFVQGMVDVTPRFPEFDAFKAILDDQSLSSREKVDALYADSMIDEWDATVAHLQENEDWHIDFWDERIDWENMKVRD